MSSIKRFVDIIISSFSLIILSPLLLITGIIIKVTMPGPLFFRQQRVGMHQKLFDILKFRSMKVDRSAEESFDFDKDEQRITTFGRLIRRLKIDELPQLLNVLKGDMSVVGPRPTIEQQVAEYDDHQRRRLDVKPGMTGLAQVNGNAHLTWEERIEYDIEYVDNHSLKLDVLILLKTVLIVLFGEGNFKKTERKVSKG
ncbi:sugar transferase [Salinicoccus sp. ID82-1]|uniref:sugar transferase n=1 Tax=Salinicoccus sp. ID82-1 TaxID=2820269 RepID=UPI001F1BB078|nr:sugar transferase [Salinicoccus sp. ID82-1]MCG1008441.1 sugar transferase [Salinicoccus sp. ID82-1]